MDYGGLGASHDGDPKLQTFVKGWFTLNLNCLAHTNWVLSTIWHIDQAPVLLRRWMPLFDPELERVDSSPIWVPLVGLPYHLWIEEVFRWIRDAMGTYLTFDASFQTTGRMAYAIILVHLDLSKGILEHINIQWRDVTRK